MASDGLTELTTHDLWIEARQFSLTISRPSPTTIELTVVRPSSLAVVDGAVLIMSTTSITPNDYPIDGKQYVGSTTFGDPTASLIDNSQVISFWSEILGSPFPTSITNADGNLQFSVTVTGTDPNTIYYASVHASTNVLQYYPIGVQSYPLEASRIEKDSSTYTGSIPSLPYAPVSPTPGMVYHDQQLNIVQYWDAANGVWIPTRTDSIMSGEYNPGVLGQTYILAGSTLKVFDGKKWVQASNSNLTFKDSTSAWVPLGKITASMIIPTDPIPGDFLYNYTSNRPTYWDGTDWVVATTSNTLFNTGATWVPAFKAPFTLEGEDLINPYIGLLFYNTRAHILNVWDGSTWIQANTDQQGTSTTDKISIGNDGSYDERLRLIKVLKAQLGWPARCVELSEEQFNVAIDNALDTYRQLSVGAYERRFMVYPLLRDQQVYYLNSPIDRTDSVVSVIKIHRLNVFGVTGSGPDNTWGQAFIQQFYNFAGGGADLLSTHLVHSWSEEFSRIFAADLPYVWNEARRELYIMRAIRANEKVVMEVEIERSEQELLLDRYCKQFIQNWALAECKEYLGVIRSKYTSGSPGASGNITLNGETLLNEARQDFTELKEALLNYEYQNGEHGNFSFMIG